MALGRWEMKVWTRSIHNGSLVPLLISHWQLQVWQARKHFWSETSTLVRELFFAAWRNKRWKLFVGNSKCNGKNTWKPAQELGVIIIKHVTIADTLCFFENMGIGKRLKYLKYAFCFLKGWLACSVPNQWSCKIIICSDLEWTLTIGIVFWTILSSPGACKGSRGKSGLLVYS